ncbi:unnamed protein product [Cladocopium goreaui]|uniref:Uncharacterized protein n=1 Tax=Cladocopium goreaui TaxID=2562237 RepID=A0A9P1BNN8_9DINO|nr:unnamed protein product [Cladocopium goreaui]
MTPRNTGHLYITIYNYIYSPEHDLTARYVEKIVEVPQVIYEERPIEVPELIHVEAVTQVPRPHVQFVKKEVPKVVLQPQERIVEVPLTLTQERPVEVPQVHVAELMVQAPSLVEFVVPKIIVQAEEKIVEVPQVFYEECLKHVPQVQVAEVIKEVPHYQKQVVQKHVPKIVETKVVEKVVPVPVNLVRETAVEVPQVVQHEVIRQKASGAMQQRIIQTGWQYQRSARKEEVVSGIAEAQQGGIYDAPVASVRRVSLPTNEVEVSAVITEQSVSHEAPVVTTVNLKPGMFAQTQVAPAPVTTYGTAIVGTMGTGTAAAPSTFRAAQACPCRTAWGTGDVSASAAATSGAAASTMRTTRAEATACANCGNVLMPDSSFCRKCGAARSVPGAPDPFLVTEPVAPGYGTINTQSTLLLGEINIQPVDHI